MAMALKLLEGKFHEESSEDESHLKDKLAMYREMQEQQQFNFDEANEEMARYKFTQRLKKIIDQPVEKPHFDEIPINLRNELNLPQNLGDYEIDF